MSSPTVVSSVMGNASHCQYFVARKKRYCRMTVKDGHNYCGEHEPSDNLSTNDNSSNNRKRIACPLDPSHSCYVNKLSKHLKICNARVVDCPEYINKGINLGYDRSIETDENRLELADIDSEEILEVIDKINKLYTDCFGENIECTNQRHKYLEDECNKKIYGENKRRHLIQTSALTGLLECENFLLPKTCFIEFGGGKGQMTFWIAKIIQDILKTEIILIDKASHRHKQDNKLEFMKERVHRIRADISDVVLNKIDYLTKIDNVIGVGKHLCGAATDLAFRCMVEHDQVGLSGIVLAFCCHHRCTWLTYTGRKWMESIGMAKKDFDIMCAISSWATCGSGLSRERRLKKEYTESNNDVHKNMSDNDCNKCNEQQNHLKRNRLGMTQLEREVIGRKTKHLIDFGRKVFLENHHYKCKFTYYVPQELTPENLCIIAKRVK